MDNNNNSTIVEDDTCPSSGGLKSVYGLYVINLIAFSIFPFLEFPWIVT